MDGTYNAHIVEAYIGEHDRIGYAVDLSLRYNRGMGVNFVVPIGKLQQILEKLNIPSTDKLVGSYCQVVIKNGVLQEIMNIMDSSKFVDYK